MHIARPLFAQPLRSGLSALGVVVGVAAVMAMLAVADGARAQMLKQIQQLGASNLLVRSLDTTDPEQEMHAILTAKHGRKLATLIPQIKRHASVKTCYARINSAQGLHEQEIIATTRDYQEIKGIRMTQGRFLCDQDCVRRQPVCILGAEIASQQPAAALGNSITIGGIPFKVVGVMQDRNWVRGEITALNDRNLNQIVFIPLGTERLFASDAAPYRGDVSELILECTSLSNLSQTLALIRRVLNLDPSQQPTYTIIAPTELMAQAVSTQRTFRHVLALLATIAIGVGGIGVMNIMLANVAERVAEIGVRRALGTTRRQIAQQFIAEAILITTLGGIVGIALGVFSSYVIGVLTNWQTQVRWSAASIAMTMAIAIGALAGFYPAHRASRISPIAALRS